MKHKDLIIERVNNGFIVHESYEPGVSGPKYVFNTPSATAVGIGNLLEHGTVERPKLPPLPPFPPNMGETIRPSYEDHRDAGVLDACIAAGFGVPTNEFRGRTTAAEIVASRERERTAEEVRRGSFEQIAREEAKCRQFTFTNVDPQAWVTIKRHGPNTTECPNPGVYRIKVGNGHVSTRHYLKVERDGSLHYGTRESGHFKVEYQNGAAWDSWAKFLQGSIWTQFRLVRKPALPHEAAWARVEDFSRVEPGDYMVKNYLLNNLIRVLANGQIVCGSWNEATQRVWWGSVPTWNNWAQLRNGSLWKEVAALPPL